MSKIFVKSREISLNPNEIQISSLGREFIFVKDFDNVNENPKIKDNIVIFAKVYMFQYVDNKDKFYFSFDCNNEYIHAKSALTDLDFRICDSGNIQILVFQKSSPLTHCLDSCLYATYFVLIHSFSIFLGKRTFDIASLDLNAVAAFHVVLAF